MSEIRLDRIHNQYVLIAPERLHRPELSEPKDTQKKEAVQKCPFCEGNESLTPPEIYAIRQNNPNTAGWRTRVVPNLYKAVQIELKDKSKRQSMFESIPGVGAHEVIIDSPSHDLGVEETDIQDIENLLRTIIIRINDLKKDKRFIHLSVFKNSGQKAGATQEHPHTQILALPIMPQNELVFLERNMKYYQRHGRGIIEDMLENEIYDKKRIVSQVGNFTAFCPYASSFPFEVMVIPNQNYPSLEYCSRDDIQNLSSIIADVFKKLKSQLGKFDYNLYFHIAPLNQNFENEQYIPYIEKNYRFTLRIVPRIYRLGGFELSTGMSINPVSPEECVTLLNSKEGS
jgi:UDPglucose--hexose-1-phosphate uridylyltransferase